MLSVVYIHQHHFLALHATKFLLISLFNAADADVVAHLIVAVLFQLVLTDFTDVSKNMGSDGFRISAQGAGLHVKTGELVQLFLQIAIILLPYLLGKNIGK